MKFSVEIEHKTGEWVGDPVIDYLGVGDDAVTADLAVVVLEDWPANVGKIMLIALVVHVVVVGIDLVKVGGVLFTDLMNPFFKNDVPAIIGSTEDFTQLSFQG